MKVKSKREIMLYNASKTGKVVMGYRSADEKVSESSKFWPQYFLRGCRPSR